MEAGNVREFVENLTMQDETVLYKGFVYYFYGIVYDREKSVYEASIDKFQDDINHFVEEFFFCERDTAEECLKCLMEAKIWDGRSFWEAEQEMTWADW